jgi:hypothetical protein
MSSTSLRACSRRTAFANALAIATVATFRASCFGATTSRVADKSRSELCQSLLPQLNAGRIVLPKDDELVRQLVGLA